MLDILDVTGEPHLGEEREMSLFPFPQGYTFRKHATSTHMGNVQTLILPILPDVDTELDPRVQDALDWYLKSLHVGSDADQFILLWITLEILSSLQAEKVSESTILPKCRHQINECPSCGEATRSYRQGATMKAFIASFDIGEEDVKKLWWMRQIVHGARSFSDERIHDLARLVQLLRAVVVTSLKAALGLEPSSPPLVSYGAPATGQSFALEGARAITNSDLHVLAELAEAMSPPPSH